MNNAYETRANFDLPPGEDITKDSILSKHWPFPDPQTENHFQDALDYSINANMGSVLTDEQKAEKMLNNWLCKGDIKGIQAFNFYHGGIKSGRTYARKLNNFLYDMEETNEIDHSLIDPILEKRLAPPTLPEDLFCRNYKAEILFKGFKFNQEYI